MIEGYNIRQISSLKGSSKSTVRRTIDYWLKRPPEIKKDYSTVEHIICDGTLLKRNIGIYAVMNACNNQILKGAYGVKEGVKDLLPFYIHLADSGLSPISATVDGNPQQLKYLRKVWPSIIIQRCIVHVQRQGLSWCRKMPKRTEAKHLRELFVGICDIWSTKEAERFIMDFKKWENQYGSMIQHSTNRGKVFSDIIRARSMLTKALPDLFHYLNNPNISRSTNTVEGYFSRLKEHYRLHRGLSPSKRNNYFNWYFYFKLK